MYYLAINYGREDWGLKEYFTVEDILKDIMNGYNNGLPWKILKELEIKIVEN